MTMDIQEMERRIRDANLPEIGTYIRFAEGKVYAYGLGEILGDCARGKVIGNAIDPHGSPMLYAEFNVGQCGLCQLRQWLHLFEIELEGTLQ